MMQNKIPRTNLIRDIRELNHIIESAHPEPYYKGGGKIAYHRRLQSLIREIPSEGLAKAEFIFQLLPFFAKIKDGHTLIEIDKSLFDILNPGGLPFMFGAVDGELYIKAVFDEAHKPWLGSLLKSIEGVPLDEIIQRVEAYIPCENRYQALGMLGSNWAILLLGEAIKRLIPEWNESNSDGKITIGLRHPDGKEIEYRIPTARNLHFPYISNQHPTHLPPLKNEKNNNFFFRFFDPDDVSGQSVALLRIANMNKYREAFELAHTIGLEFFNQTARSVYQQYQRAESPENEAEILAGIPSVTETFINLFERMKAEKTKYLIVDLRNNLGGFSIMNQILTYFLVGFEETVALQKSNGTITKYSNFRDQASVNEPELTYASYTDWVPLKSSDYDFSLDPQFMGERLEIAIREEILRDFKSVPTFFEEFQSREHEAHYFPEKIYILSSELTFSSGFNLMTDLYKVGGEIVGVPSSQAGNSCGDTRPYRLRHSQIEGTVSTRSFTAFVDDPDKGKLLLPQHPLTYEKFKSYEFDENAALRYALEIIGNMPSRL